MIKNILFDLGGVVVDYDPNALLARLHERHKCSKPLSFYQKEVWNWHVQWDYGNISDLVNETVEKQPDDEAYIRDFAVECFDEVRVIYPEMLEAIKIISARGYRLFYASNWPKDMFESLNDFMQPFLSHMEGGVISGDLSLVKPDPAFFQSLLEKYDLDKKESLFLDDREANVEAAQKFGLETLHVLSPVQAAEKLLKITS